ncbi:unnamed protein product [Moneuplotes crassus]|uniref:Protein kinase domain-containing protein n=1 Tax=Euplotes crassus TaxID=5936 RepID=A0AAD1XIL8_EUPCR|nr:unnamed protein product [Moneuplotes crassus]
METLSDEFYTDSDSDEGFCLEYKHRVKEGQEDDCFEYIKFYIGENIASGAFGTVYFAHVIESNIKKLLPSTMACKKIEHKGDDYTRNIVKNAEVKFTQTGRTKSLIHLYCAIDTKDAIYLFFAFHNGRDLKTLMEMKGKMPEKLCAKIIKQILKGLTELHQRNIIHRDIKPDNILIHFDCLDPSKLVKREFLQDWDPEVHDIFSIIITDLGISCNCDSNMENKVGTMFYLAPECFDSTYDHSADILSLGLIAFEMLTGKKLFTYSDMGGDKQKLCQLWKDKREYEIHCSYEARQFLQHTIQVNPYERLKADELLFLDFIENAYNENEYTCLENLDDCFILPTDRKIPFEL